MLVAFGIADVGPLTDAVEVADLKPEPFAQTQTEAVEGEKDRIAEHAGFAEDPLGFGDCDDVRQALECRRLDQARRDPRFLQHVLAVEL